MVRASEVIDKLANYVNLADLPNRTMFMDKLNSVINQVKEQKRKAAVFLVDVDNLADLNNAYGFKFGDDLLINIGEVLYTRFHGNEFLSHYDGDCFALFVPDIRDGRDATNIAKKIIKTFHMPWLLDKHECYSTVSVGISMYPDNGKNAEELIKNAESALSLAKRKGMSQYQLYTKEIVRIKDSSCRLADMFMNALASVQFQDVTRQQIEQVVDALGRLDGHAQLLAARLERFEDDDTKPQPLAEHLDEIYSNYVMEAQRDTHQQALGTPGSSKKSASGPKVELF
jgi:diguanylate cyclase (GGDEF)-like protein